LTKAKNTTKSVSSGVTSRGAHDINKLLLQESVYDANQAVFQEQTSVKKLH